MWKLRNLERVSQSWNDFLFEFSLTPKELAAQIEKHNSVDIQLLTFENHIKMIRAVGMKQGDDVIFDRWFDKRTLLEQKKVELNNKIPSYSKRIKRGIEKVIE